LGPLPGARRLLTFRDGESRAGTDSAKGAPSSLTAPSIASPGAIVSRDSKRGGRRAEGASLSSEKNDRFGRRATWVGRSDRSAQQDTRVRRVGPDTDGDRVPDVLERFVGSDRR